MPYPHRLRVACTYASAIACYPRETLFKSEIGIPFTLQTRHKPAPPHIADMAEPRTRWLDSARGAGAVLVVVGHVERGLTGAGLAEGEAFQRFDLALYTFHMPLFFLLAGINSGRSIDRSWLILLRRKIVTIIYPYILWSLVQGSVVAVMAKSTTGMHNWHDLLLIAWRPMAQFWFLYALFVYSIGAAVLRGNAVLILAIGMIAVVAADHVHPGSPIDLGLHHMIFFGVGMAFSRRIIAWCPRRILWVAGAAAAVWVVGWQIVPHGQRFAYLTVRALPCAFAGSVCVMAAAQSVGVLLQTLLAWLGKRAMTIFVFHILAASGVRIGLVLADVSLSASQHMILGTACGLALPCAVQTIAERLGIARVLALKA